MPKGPWGKKWGGAWSPTKLFGKMWGGARGRQKPAGLQRPPQNNAQGPLGEKIGWAIGPNRNFWENVGWGPRWNNDLLRYLVAAWGRLSGVAGRDKDFGPLLWPSGDVLRRLGAVWGQSCGRLARFAQILVSVIRHAEKQKTTVFFWFPVPVFRFSAETGKPKKARPRL